MISVKDDNSITRKSNCGIAVVNRKQILRGMPFGFKHVTLFRTKGFQKAVGALDIRLQLQYPKTTVLAPNRASREMLAKYRTFAPFPLLMASIKSAKGADFGYKKTQVSVTVGEFEVQTEWWTGKDTPKWKDSKFWCDCGVKTMEIKLRQKVAMGFVKTRGIVKVDLEKYTGGNVKEGWLTCVSPSGSPAGQILVTIQMMFYHSVMVPPDFDKRHLNFRGEMGRTVSMAQNHDHNMLFLTRSQADLMSAVYDSKKAAEEKKLHKERLERFEDSGPGGAAVPEANANYVGMAAGGEVRRASAGDVRGASSQKAPHARPNRASTDGAAGGESGILADIAAIDAACKAADAAKAQPLPPAAGFGGGYNRPKSANLAAAVAVAVPVASSHLDASSPVASPIYVRERYDDDDDDLQGEAVASPLPPAGPHEQPALAAVAEAVPISLSDEVNSAIPTPAEAAALKHFALMGLNPSHNAAVLQLLRDSQGDLNATAQRAIANGLF